MRPAVASALVAICAFAAPAAAQRAAGDAPARALLVVGDSLGLFTVPHLERRLDGWHVTARARPARRATEAPRILRAFGPSLPPVIHVSLGTIDPPARVRAFRRALRTVMRLAGRRRCVVWTNIYRPALGEATYDDFNQILARQDARRANLRVVDWEAMVAANLDWLLGDAVHVTAQGYRARARAVASEVRLCRRSLT